MRHCISLDLRPYLLLGVAARADGKAWGLVRINGSGSFSDGGCRLPWFVTSLSGPSF